MSSRLEIQALGSDVRFLSQASSRMYNTAVHRKKEIREHFGIATGALESSLVREWKKAPEHK